MSIPPSNENEFADGYQPPDWATPGADQGAEAQPSLPQPPQPGDADPAADQPVGAPDQADAPYQSPTGTTYQPTGPAYQSPTGTSYEPTAPYQPPTTGYTPATTPYDAPAAPPPPAGQADAASPYEAQQYPQVTTPQAYRPPVDAYQPPVQEYQFPAAEPNPQVAQPYYPTAATPPENYLVWAILTTVLCCMPLGIVSIVMSTQVNQKWAVGDFEGAQKAAASAKNFAIASAVAALVVWLVVAIFYIAVFAMAVSTTMR
ncbi:MAG: CD225/dispanin family protein [Propionibacteriaceae bacterium]|jgi:hypothetical protein|nr:CD225/dispanin family protein [Propionibacteriaceae bacterium]